MSWEKRYSSFWTNPDKFSGDRQDKTSRYSLEPTYLSGWHSDSLSALFFDKMIVNKVEATAQSCSVLALAHRATPSPGSICSHLDWKEGKKIQVGPLGEQFKCCSLTLQRAKIDAVSGKYQMCYYFLHIVVVQRREKKKILSLKLSEKVQKASCREKLKWLRGKNFRLRGN